ncbi:MAG: right-handed parallel beta-helix repeat-containing protein [Terriglobia bacterium]
MKSLTLPFCLAAFLTVLAAQSAQTFPSAGQVLVRPEDNIQSLVVGHPPGTTFVITPGTYRLQSIRPKDGDTFIGQKGATLVGAALIGASAWRQGSSGVWVAQVSGMTPQSSYRGECDSKHPACKYPEDLFFDSKPFTRVASLSQVGPGAWFLDYSTEKAYVGSDPGGHTVEISIAQAAFWGSAGKVTIKGLAIEKYASLAGKGAINAMASLNGYGPVGTGWVVESNDVYLNHGVGIRASDGMTVRNNKIHDNGQMGLAGSGSNILVEGNEIYGNNYAGYAYDWEAGGVKFAMYSTHVTLDSNYVHDNKGPGLHGDIGDDDFVFENNHTARNWGSGIHWEISYHAVIRNNRIEDDGISPDGTGFWYGGGILVSNSSDVEVYGNTVTDCTNGIGGTEADRGVDSKTGIPYNLKNLYVHDNTITQKTGFAAGIVKSSKLDNSVFTSWNNRFSNNTYHLGSKAGRFFEWLNSPQALAAWQRHVWNP